MTYRNLTEDEVLRLKSQSCLADDWGNITVAEEFSTEFVHHTRFSGEVRLGVFQLEFTLPGGIRKHSGLRHVTLHNVTVGDNCCIENIQNYIANYEIPFFYPDGEYRIFKFLSHFQLHPVMCAKLLFHTGDWNCQIVEKQ